MGPKTHRDPDGIKIIKITSQRSLDTTSRLTSTKMSRGPLEQVMINKATKSETSSIRNLMNSSEKSTCVKNSVKEQQRLTVIGTRSRRKDIERRQMLREERSVKPSMGNMSQVRTVRLTRRIEGTQRTILRKAGKLTLWDSIRLRFEIVTTSGRKCQVARQKHRNLTKPLRTLNAYLIKRLRSL